MLFSYSFSANFEQCQRHVTVTYSPYDIFQKYVLCVSPCYESLRSCKYFPRWFTDYLDKRKQRVVLPGTASSWTSIKAGVPQGSILGPLLFLVYINDIIEYIHSSIRLFADDTSLYIIVDDPIDSANKLNNDLQTINLWAKT